MALPDPQIVATAFADRYYNVLLNSPALSYNFYEDASVVSWPGSDGKLQTVTTVERIKQLIVSQDYQGCRVKVETIDGQASSSQIFAGGGVIVVVTGTWKGSETIQSFTETFLLAPRKQQKRGYYVLNDIFVFVGEPLALTPSYSSEVVVDNDAAEQASLTTLVQDPKSLAVVRPTEIVPAPKEEEEVVFVSAPASEEKQTVVTKTENIVTKPVTQEVPKKMISYASMAAKEVATNFAADDQEPAKNKVVVVAPSSTHYLDRLKPKSNNNNNNNNKDKTNYVEQKKFNTSANKNNRGRASASNTNTADNNGGRAAASNTNTVDTHEARRIYIRNLPTGVTIEYVNHVFKNAFGPIRKGGVRVITREDGYCFGFVEFESATSATCAIEAYKIIVGPNEAYIAPKKISTNQRYSNNGNNNHNNVGGGDATYNIGRSPSGGDCSNQLRQRSESAGNKTVVRGSAAH